MSQPELKIAWIDSRRNDIQAAMAELREKMPHTDLSEFERDPDINKVGDLFTVNAIVNFVENKLNAA